MKKVPNETRWVVTDSDHDELVVTLGVHEESGHLAVGPNGFTLTLSALDELTQDLAETRALIISNGATE